MTAHHSFAVGRTVRVKALPRDEPVQAFEVIRQMPVDQVGMPQYRIRGVTTGLERLVREVDVEPFEPGPVGGGRS